MSKDHGYELGRKLGEGAYAIVQQATKVQDGATQYFAVKSYLTNTPALAIDKEVKIAQSLKDQPIDKIVLFCDIILVSSRRAIVMEFIDGEDLFARITRMKATYSEIDAAHFMFNFIGALHNLHLAGYLHRDLKAQNVMCCGTDVKDYNYSQFKIVDLGLAVKLSVEDVFGCGLDMKEKVGSPDHLAPETFENKYSAKSDIWSAGVILFCILSGTSPFGRKPSDYERKIKAGLYSVHTKEWQTVSDAAKDLVRRMLTVDPAKRISATEILNHPWITQYCVPTQEKKCLDGDDSAAGADADADAGLAPMHVMEGLAQLVKEERFQKTVQETQICDRIARESAQQLAPCVATCTDTASSSAASVVCNLDPVECAPYLSLTADQLTELHRKFTLARGGGQATDGINCASFCNVMHDIGLPSLAAEHVFKIFDKDDSGDVDYNEFLMTLASFSNDLERVVRLYFNIFDKDGNGSISFEEFTRVIGTAGLFDEDGLLKVHTEELDKLEMNSDNPCQSFQRLFDMIDADHNQEISFEEFKNWMDKDAQFLHSIFVDPVKRSTSVIRIDQAAIIASTLHEAPSHCDTASETSHEASQHPAASETSHQHDPVASETSHEAIQHDPAASETSHEASQHDPAASETSHEASQRDPAASETSHERAQCMPVEPFSYFASAIIMILAVVILICDLVLFGNQRQHHHKN